MYGDEQFTIVLHNEVLSALEDTYGKLEIQRGKVLEFLGLTLDYSVKGVCEFSAEVYIKKAISSFGGEIKGKAKTPAADKLFVVREDATPLPEGKRKNFQLVFALLLWIATMARPDILVSISFLGKHTTKADEDDAAKLGRVLSYLRKTTELRLDLGADNMPVMK